MRKNTKVSIRTRQYPIQTNILKDAAEHKTGTTLTTTKKNFQDEQLAHELFLTTRQKTKIINAFGNNILTDIKLNKAQLSQIIQKCGFLRNMEGSS